MLHYVWQTSAGLVSALEEWRVLLYCAELGTAC